MWVLGVGYWEVGLGWCWDLGPRCQVLGSNPILQDQGCANIHCPKIIPKNVERVLAAWLWNAMRGGRTQRWQSGLVVLSQTRQCVEELKYGWKRPKYMENKSVWIYKPQYLWHQLGNQPVPVWDWLIQLLQSALGPWACSSSSGKVQQVRDRTDGAPMAR